VIFYLRKAWPLWAGLSWVYGNVIVTTIHTEATMKIDPEYLIEKYTEIHDEAEDWETKNLALEFIEDLRDLLRG
jgi:hypothetical protein